MTKTLFIGTFLLGVFAILWIGKIFFGDDSLGLGVTVLIGGVYLLGTLELLQFRRATNSLNRSLAALTQPIDDLYQWLTGLDLSLQNAVRLRIDGERVGLPAPILTPYLVGLLVMLGLLGTFVGMVDTLKGAVVALEGNSELTAIRAGLAAPIEGLGLAFGTSVAGVAASAMLGLLSTISRRERLQASHLLDTNIAGALRTVSGTYRQQLAFQAIVDQAETLPAVAQQLSNLAVELEKMGEGVSERLLSNQTLFQNTMSSLYTELNDSVSESLQVHMVESAETLNSSVQGMMATSIAKLGDAVTETQHNMEALNQQQLALVTENAQNNSTLIRESINTSLDKQANSTTALVEMISSTMLAARDDLQNNSKAMLETIKTASQNSSEQHSEHALNFTTKVEAQIDKLRNQESQRSDASIERLSELESTVAKHLTELGVALEEPMARLIETASQAPKAAADMIETLRGEMSKNLERDNDLLSERTRLMKQLDTLSSTLEKNSIDQRDAVDNLVGRSADTLSQLGSEFSQRTVIEYSKLETMVEHFSKSSLEMASLGDAFNSAVTLFSESNNKLIENLSDIEASLEQAGNRNDEQLAYYVAQAREIIDHNVLSHKEIIDAVRTQQPHSMTQRAG